MASKYRFGHGLRPVAATSEFQHNCTTRRTNTGTWLGLSNRRWRAPVNSKERKRIANGPPRYGRRVLAQLADRNRPRGRHVGAHRVQQSLRLLGQSAAWLESHGGVGLPDDASDGEARVHHELPSDAIDLFEEGHAWQGGARDAIESGSLLTDGRAARVSLSVTPFSAV